MREVAWITFHLVVALPIALALSVVLRELLRAVVALATGFRIFEIRLGVGRNLFSTPIGPIDFSLGALPLGGATIAASGDAKRHRITRVALTIAPLLAQLAWLLWTVGPGSANLATIQSGFAPITIFAIAQSALFALHLLLPMQWGTDESTDIRALIDIVFGEASDHRRARAAYYVRAARHAIERGEIERAHAALQQGLTQLGPEPLLIECQTIMATRELRSVIDQGESAEAMLILLEWSPADPGPARSRFDALERFGRRGIYALPLLCAVTAYATAHHDAIEIALTKRWISTGAAIVETASAEACAAHRIQAKKWPRRLDPDAAASIRRDHHHLTAQLLACEGAADHAEKVAQSSLEAAEEARATHYVGAIGDLPLWVEDELRLVDILGFRGELKLRLGEFRRALQTLERADRELNLVRQQLAQTAGGAERPGLTLLIDAQAERISAQRRQIRNKMASRSLATADQIGPNRPLRP